MEILSQKPIFHKGAEGQLALYTLAPGIRLSFNEIYTSSWEKEDSSIFGERMLIVNFCIHGRCDVSLAKNRYAIVKENQVCISTNAHKGFLLSKKSVRGDTALSRP